ncbi:uncharacterized protein LOC124533379 [Vanessa cardui]|uniref:uncharacterized protein LOC124533379 n=1 Tax=Vanessa cardui TaxID=171605 RepID=UPI001F141D35|nr:uncharacterized protein LOC124533379 [Vanessa cardui]
MSIENCEAVDDIRINYKHLEDKFHNCTITIGALENVPHFLSESNKEFSFLGENMYGTEQQMLANIAERENITLKYIFRSEQIPKFINAHALFGYYVHEVVKLESPCQKLNASVSLEATVDDNLSLLSAINALLSIPPHITSPFLHQTTTQSVAVFRFEGAQLLSGLQELSKDIGWRPTAQFIIQIHDLKWSEHDEIFKLFLKLNVYNILLMTKSKNGRLSLITYNPFKNNSCGKSFYETIIIKNCEAVDFIKMNYKHLEDKFRNCTITIAALENAPHYLLETNKEYFYLGKKMYGVEQQMLANIAKKENITLKYVFSSDLENPGMVLRNFTVTGLFSYLKNDSASILSGGFTLLKNRVDVFDCIWGYNYGNLLIFAPASYTYSWKTFYGPFGVTTWALILLSFVCVTVATILISRYFGDNQIYNNIPLKLWGYLFANISDKLFHMKKLRIIVIAWIWFSFLIVNFYSTALYSLLTAKEVKPEPFNPENLDSIELTPCLSDGMLMYFKNVYKFDFFGKSSRKCEKEFALDVVAKNKDFYTIDLDYKYYMREFRYIDEKGKNKVKTATFGSGLIFSMYTQKGFPLQKKFQRYAHYHFETGLLKKQKETIYYWYNMRNNKRSSYTFKLIL